MGVCCSYAYEMGILSACFCSITLSVECCITTRTNRVFSLRTESCLLNWSTNATLRVSYTFA